MPERLPNQPAGPEAESARRQHQGQSGDEEYGPCPHWPSRRPELARQHECTAGNQTRRNRVTERAEREAHPLYESLADGAPAPMQIGGARQEDPDRDQRQADDVEVMRL